MRVSVLSLALLLSACTSRGPRPPEGQPAERVTILTYNVENLFDTEDDPEKNDDAFLPASAKKGLAFQNKCRTVNERPGSVTECLNKNWSERVLDRKMRRLADVVAQVGGGRGPDILILEEVESLQVINRWRETYLKPMNYNSVAYVKGPDERGINPAILSRLPLKGEPVLHRIDFTKLKADARPSRGILEARFELPGGEALAVFAVHFPSQGAPTEFRKLATETLLEITQKLPPETNIVVGGDFNITAKEEHQQKYFAGPISQRFAVSHLVGCRSCAGTIFFPPDNTWSFFDVLLFSKNLLSPQSAWRLEPGSIRVVNSSAFQVNRFGSPARFGSGLAAVGVSDHWPMYAELHLNAATTEVRP